MTIWPMMIVILKKRHFAYLASFIFLLALLISLPILEKIIVSYSVENYVKKQFKAKLIYEDIRKEKGAWQIISPKVLNSQNGFNIQADLIEVIYHISPLEWLLDLSIKIHHSKVSLTSLESPLKSRFQLMHKSPPLIKINQRITFIDGTFEALQNELKDPFYFNLEMIINQKELQNLTLQLSEDLTENFLALQRNGFKYNLAFKNLDCHKATCLLKMTDPRLKKIDVDQGKLSGNAEVNWQNIVPSINGLLVFEGISARHENLHGWVPKLEMGFEEHGQHTTGRLEFADHSVLKNSYNNQEFWTLQLKPGFLYLSADAIKAELEGPINFDEKILHLKVFGERQFDFDNRLNVSFNFTQGERFYPPIEVIYFKNQKENLLNIKTSGLNPSVGKIFSSVAAYRYPDLVNVEFADGEIQLESTVNWSQDSLKNFQIEAGLKDLLVNYRSSQIKIPELRTKLGFEYQNFWQTASGFISVDKSRIRTEYGVEFDHLSALINLKKGSFENSSIAFQLEDLTATAKMDSTWKNPFQAELKGKISPNHFKKISHGIGLNHEREIQAHLILEKKGLKDSLQGNIRLNEQSDTPEITYDITLFKDKTLSLSKESQSDSLFQDILHFFEYEAWQGKLEGHEISFEKVIQPFLPLQTIKIEGDLSFKGEFDRQGINLRYSSREISLSNKFFQLDLKDISKNDHQLATHYFNFLEGTHEGTFFIENGNYIEKNSGLLFTEVQSQVNIKNKFISLPSVETYNNGIYFAGALNIDLSPPEKGFFNILIDLQAATGKASQVREMLSHFRKSFLNIPLPLEGQISLRESSRLQLNFFPDDYNLAAEIKGQLNDGTIKSENLSVAVQDINAKFDYIHGASLLDISDIQGAVFIGKGKKVEEYIFAGDFIRFSNCSKGIGDFDIWIGDRTRDILRLVGHTTPDGEENLNVSFDHEISHFGDVYPEVIRLNLKNWSTVQNLDLNFKFDLKQIANDLEGLVHFNFLGLPPVVLKHLKDLKKAEGLFNVSFNYNQEDSFLSYKLEGSDFNWQEKPFKYLCLNGKIHHQKWSIDQLTFGDFSLTGELIKKESDWKINHLGFRWKDAVLAGLQGAFFSEEKRLHTRFNLFDIDFLKLRDSFLKNIFDLSKISGRLKGEGLCDFFFEESLDKCSYQGDFLIDASPFDYEKFKMDAFKAKLKITSDEIVSEDIETALLSSKNSTLVPLKIKKLGYSIRENLLSLTETDFTLSKESWAEIIELFRENVPQLWTEDRDYFLKQIKLDNDIKGVLNIDKSGPYTAFDVQIPEPSVLFDGKLYQINQLNLEWDPFDLFASFEYSDRKETYSCHIKGNNPNFDEGKAVIKPKNKSKAIDEALTIHWKIDHKLGLILEKIQGLLNGLSIELGDDHTTLNTHQWKGCVNFDFSQFKNHLSEESQIGINRLQLGQGLSLNGQFALDKKIYDGETLLLKATGILTGYEFDLKSYKFSNLVGHLELSPGSLKLADLKIEDRAIKLYLQSLVINDSKFYLPTLLIHQFRPYLLRSNNENNYSKSLMIEAIEIDQFKGVLNQTESWTGKGHCTFTNYKKKNAQNILFAIPSEILTRLGLDLSLLNPVTGTILFEFAKDKVALRKFVDMYSEGKLSKFNLLDDEHSYVDWEGGLNIQLRLKQNNMLLKLGEMFHFTIQGDLKKPTYNVLRHSDKIKYSGKHLYRH